MLKLSRILKLSVLLLGSVLLSQCSMLNGSGDKVAGQALPTDCHQVIVGIPDNWDTSHVKLVMMERDANGEWRQVMSQWPARLGKKGSVWGLGMSPVPAGGRIKQEGDQRTPVGIFALDHLVYAYDEKTPVGKGFSTSKITPYDLWIEDPTSPLYNHHLKLDRLPTSTWEGSQQMKQNDPSHKLKLFIHHNSPKDISLGRPIAKAGSSIFFHIWRDEGNRPTAGCTSMSESKLREMLSRLDVSKNPVYVILPKAEYAKYSSLWNLPHVEG